MGQFSWLKADDLTQVANITYNAIIKVLIPLEFGGGFIKGAYNGYGRIQSQNGNVYDLHELLYLWNENNNNKKDRKLNPLKTVDEEFTDDNSWNGICINTDANIVDLKYPLKLVSASYDGTYEDLDMISFNCPWQGERMTRTEFEKVASNFVKQYRCKCNLKKMGDD